MILHQAAVSEQAATQPTGGKKNYCYHFKNNGWCRFGDKCRYSHDIENREVTERSQDKDATKDKGKDKGGTKTKVQSIAINAAVFTSFETVAMLDSGANEVVRPFNKTWWEAVKEGRAHGKRIAETLAGGV